MAAGEAIFSAGVAKRVLGFLSGPPVVVSEAFPQLTARERDTLDLLTGGLSNAAIADRLRVAPKTVANNLSSIFAKLQVADRNQAIVRARDAGLGHQDTPPGG